MVAVVVELEHLIRGREQIVAGNPIRRSRAIVAHGVYGLELRLTHVGWKPHFRDSGAPTGLRRCRVVERGVPERARPRRIDVHRAVVSPSRCVGVRLGAATVHYCSLRSQSPCRIRAAPIRDPKTRKGLSVGHAVADHDVAGRIHCETPHPSVQGVGGVRALLKDGPCPVGRAPQLVPANACEIVAGRVHGVIEQ